MTAGLRAEGLPASVQASMQSWAKAVEARGPDTDRPLRDATAQAERELRRCLVLPSDIAFSLLVATQASFALVRAAEQPDGRLREARITAEATLEALVIELNKAADRDGGMEVNADCLPGTQN